MVKFIKDAIAENDEEELTVSFEEDEINWIVTVVLAYEHTGLMARIH